MTEILQMRLLLVVYHIAAVRSFLTELVSALAARGVDVHCACSTESLWDAGDTGPDLPLTIHPIRFARGMNPLQHIQTSWQLHRLVSTLKPDIVHAHLSNAIFTTALARRRHWPTTIGTFQGVGFLLSSGLKGRILGLAETWAARRLDHIWVLTDDDLAALRMAAPHARIYRQATYGFGCDLNHFTSSAISSDDRAILWSQLAITPQHRVFAFVGRFVHFKGFDITVRAFLKLAQTDPDSRLLLIGKRDGLHPTGLTVEEEAILKQSSNIIDVGWQRDVRRYLAVTQIVVFPSQREGMPVCLMEALAMGVPVITRDSRGCRDVVRDQVDGIVLQECTVDSLVQAMQRLSNDHALRELFASRALAGRERFSRHNYVQEQLHIYEQLRGRKSLVVRSA
jgi:glycosyltransferase involved in cell wall biosynthesis